MADLATLRIVVDANGAIRSVDSFRHATDKGSAASKRFEASQRLVQGAIRSVVAVIGAYVGTRFVAETIKMADTAKLLEGRLRLVSTSIGNLTFLERQLTESAKRTRSGYADTVTLYARVARNADQLGKSQADLLKFTELTQMAIKASGATAQEASAGMIQLSQALASGTLRGDEFRSVAEQMPALASAIADGLGVKSVGALRALAFEGELTAEKVVDAVLKMDASIRRDFATSPQLVGEAWRAMKDDVLRAVNEIDQGVNGTSKFATAIREFGDGIRDNLMAARIWFLEFEVAVTRTLAKTDRAIAKSNLAIGAALQLATKGAMGGGTVANALVDIAELTTLIDGLAIYQEEQYKVITGQKTLEELLAETGTTAAAVTTDVDNLSSAYKRLAAAIKAPATALNSRAGINTAITAGGLNIADLSPQRGFTLGSGVMNLPRGFGIGNSMTAMRSDDAGVQAVIRWRAEMDKANEDVAKNFRENIQRSIGSFFSDFLTQGGSAVRGLFSNLSSVGADLFGEALSKVVTPKISELTTGQSLALGAGLGVLGSVVTGFIDSGRQFRAEMDAARRAMADWSRGLREWITDSEMVNATVEERAALDIQRRGERAARDAFDIYRKAPGDFLAGLTGDAANDRAVIEQLLARTGGSFSDPSNPFGQTPAKLLKEYYDALTLVSEGVTAATDATKAQAEAAQRAAAAERALSLTQTVESLAAFRHDLGQSSLSIFNPMQQSQDARAEYERILALAKGGDQAAAGQLPAAAQAFLESSRAINASGARYVADFQRVTSDTRGLEALFETEREVQQRIADGQTAINETLNTSNDIAREQREITREVGKRTLERLDALIDRVVDVERGISYRGASEPLAA